MPKKSAPLDRTLVDPPRPLSATADGQIVARRGVERRLSLLRAPLARLLIFDDDSDEQGEMYRLREQITRIGRSDGEIRIANDPDLSRSHFRIERVEAESSTDEPNGGRFQWWLFDDDSTNGTYVRRPEVELRDRTEIRLGRGHYLWTAGMNGTTNRDNSRDAAGTLVSLDDSSRRWSFRSDKPTSLGYSGGPAAIGLADDPALDDHHATIVRLACGRWMLTDQASVNGVWTRVEKQQLNDGAEILAGGQRFRFYGEGSR